MKRKALCKMQWMKNRWETKTNPDHRMAKVHIRHLYLYRGEAQVGFIGGNKRDCLHFCVGMGVLDGLALETISAIQAKESASTPHTEEN